MGMRRRASRRHRGTSVKGFEMRPGSQPISTVNSTMTSLNVEEFDLHDASICVFLHMHIRVHSIKALVDTLKLKVGEGALESDADQ